MKKDRYWYCEEHAAGERPFHLAGLNTMCQYEECENYAYGLYDRERGVVKAAIIKSKYA